MKIKKFGRHSIRACGCGLVKCKICNPYFYGGTIDLWLHIALVENKKHGKGIYINGQKLK